MSEPETVAVNLGDKTVTLPLPDAIGEYLRLDALISERPLKEDENRVHAGLVLALGTLNTGDGARQLYEALT